MSRATAAAILTSCIFLAGCVSPEAKVARPCDTSASIAVESEDAVIVKGYLGLHDGTLYPPGAFWREESGRWRVCPCKIRPCIRYCPEELFDANNRSSYNARISVWINDQPRRVLPKSQFYVIHEAECARSQPVEGHTFRVLANGSLTLKEELLTLEEFCIVPQKYGDIPVTYRCFVEKDTASVKLVIFSSISAAFLVLTIAILCVHASKSNSLHVRSLICLASCLLFSFLAQIISEEFDGAEERVICSASGYLNYCFNLSFHFWLNVICVQIYRSRLTRHHREFVALSIYAWGVPFAALLVALCLDLTLDPHWSFVPGFGTFSCWFKGTFSKAIFLDAAIVWLSIINIVLLIGSLKLLREQRNSASQHLLTQNVRSLESRVINAHHLGVCIALFAMILFTFLFSFSVAWMASEASFARHTADALFAFRGLFVFLICVLFNPPVKRSVKEKITRLRTHRPLIRVKHVSAPTGCLGTLSRNPSVCVMTV